MSIQNRFTRDQIAARVAQHCRDLIVDDQAKREAAGAGRG